MGVFFLTEDQCRGFDTKFGKDALVLIFIKVKSMAHL